MSEEADLLDGLFRRWNIACSADASSRLLRFALRMLEWNARINLTGAKSPRDLVSEHLVDSFAMARFLPLGCSLADVGSGGGLPSIPLSVLRPDVHLTLVEPRAKRVAFLRSAVHELGLSKVEIFRCRIEELDPLPFDACASRATFPPEEWLLVGRRLVKPGGRVLVFANEPWSPGDPATRLVECLEYVTGGGRRRWLGSFCFT